MQVYIKDLFHYKVYTLRVRRNSPHLKNETLKNYLLYPLSTLSSRGLRFGKSLANTLHLLHDPKSGLLSSQKYSPLL